MNTLKISVNKDDIKITIKRDENNNKFYVRKQDDKKLSK